ncbi:mucin-5AC-like isoform X2 [Siniperca chuatsi]|uniref:mucin-5AC-like isoform X2 n=1 Tax=Siniperca chuatsi TaxID=119488 RepID=UPI001CE0FD77|nr:mucin-5AC-like isoform X2 [Siniperca chuatsi]
MAAALFRGGTGLCVRCIHRELCRLVWRPQTALLSSKPSDRKQPRRTHIKKAKPQPAVDVAKLLEQLFSQRRPGMMPPAARPAKAASMPTKPSTTSSLKVSTSNVPPMSKTEPAVSVFPAASSFKQVDSVPTSTFNTAPPSPQPNSVPPTNPKTLNSSETTQQSPLDFIQAFAADSVSNVIVPTASMTPASLGSEAAAIEIIIETNVETAPEPAELKPAAVPPLSAHMSFSAATIEPLIETTTESPVEPSLSPVETLEVRAAVVEGPVEHTVDAPAEEVQTKGTDSGVADVSHSAKEEPLIETTIESPVEASHFPTETLETRAAIGEGPVEPTIDVTVDIAAQKVQTKSTDSGVVGISHTATVEPLLETTVETSVEARTSPLETLESRAAVVECAVEPTVDATVDAPVQAVQTNSTGSGPVNLSHTAEEEPLIETTIEPAVETSTSPIESRAAVSEGTIDPTIENEAADNLSHTALSQNAQESAPLPLKNEVESSSGSVAVEEGVNKPEQMTLESGTLREVKVLAESLKTDELVQTKSDFDEKAEIQLQELLDQTGTGAESKAAAETENSSQDESEILTQVLSKWDSLSEDLQELEGDSGTLVKELLRHVPAVLPKTPGTLRTSSASDPPAGANGDSLQMEEKATDAEAMESITLAKVKAEVGGLENEILLETRNALEKEAEVRAKEEKMEVETTIEDVSVFEGTTEAEILTLESISEANDAIKAETSVILEAMFGSEQGPRQPPDTLLVDQKLGRQDEAIGQEAEKESGEKEGSVLEAMTLESVTLAEVEASLGTLENESLSETTDYLEKEAEILAGEKGMEVEDGVASEETTEALKIEFLSLAEGDALSEALQADTLMEELLFSVPGHVTGVTQDPIGQELVRANILDATVAAGSVDVDKAAAETDDFPASPVLKDVPPGQEEEEGAQTEALGKEDDLDPVQRLFLEKIREYDNMRRLNGGLLEAEPDYKKYLSEETAKLQRLYGGGDLSSFPEFTFTEPKMDQDSK